MIFIMFLNITFLINVEEPPPPAPSPHSCQLPFQQLNYIVRKKGFFSIFFSSALKIVFVGGGSHQHIWSLYQSVIGNQTNRRSTFFFSSFTKWGSGSWKGFCFFFFFFFDLPFLIFSI